MSDSSRSSDSDYLNLLLALAEQSGLDAVGVASAEPFAEARRRLEERRGRGLASNMRFTYRNPRRSCDPAAALPEARSLIVGALRYEKGDTTGEEDIGGRIESGRDADGRKADGTAAEGGETAGDVTEGMLARVAAYAQRDYYGDLRTALEIVAGRLRDDGFEARVVADDNALMDREAARRAGLGWYGKNTCLLIPKRGSRFVLGSVITTAALTPNDTIDRTCGTCSACQAACPTGALDITGQLDARKCLAWLLQAEGVFPREHRAPLGDRLYGCDDCQDVCPVNSIELARKRHTVARLPLETRSRLDSVPVLDVLKSTDEELMDLYGRFYIPRREPRYLRRNALLVLGNIALLRTSLNDEAVDKDGDTNITSETTATLKEAVEHEDPILRAHGVWAAQRLGRFDLAERASSDPDARVREEARRPVPLLEMHA